MKGFEFKFELKPRYTIDYIVGVLQNTVANTVTLGVSKPSPLKRNLDPRFVKGVGVLTGTMNNHMFPSTILQTLDGENG
jgi:hypothetical protein